jgi:hypothetical protein
MPTIKITSNGLIITKDGRPSCTCCGGEDCDGLWGPGYDTHPDTITVTVPALPEPYETVERISVMTRVSKCLWEGSGSCGEGPVEYEYVTYNIGLGWHNRVTICQLPELGSDYITFVGFKGNPPVPGISDFDSGPLGSYVGDLVIGTSTVT